MSAARALPLFALLLAAPGCAGSGVPPAASALDTEISEQDSIVPGAAIEASVEQTGRVVTLAARGTCDLHRIVTVDRLVPHSREPGSGARSMDNTGVAAGFLLGVGGIVGGSLVIHEATTTPTVNPGAKVVGGAVLGALGLGITGLMIWALTPGADRSSAGTYTTVERATRDDGLVQSNVPCEDVRSIPGFLPITGRLPGPRPVEIALGSTDNRGKLRFDVTEAIPPELLSDPATPRTMPIYIRGVNAAIVRIDSGSVEPPRATWDGAAAARCAAAPLEESCGPVERYLRDFPTGLHAAEAKLALSKGEAARAAAASARQKEQLQEGEAEAQIQAATRAAKEGTREACRKICATSCKGAVDCTNRCAEKSCDH
ncbi:MAG: hypothetical protein ABJE95_24005 [Byssovorax sp.]